MNVLLSVLYTSDSPVLVLLFEPFTVPPLHSIPSHHSTSILLPTLYPISLSPLLPPTLSPHSLSSPLPSQDGMYSFENESQTFALKPMNCPGHWLVYICSSSSSSSSSSSR